MEKEEKSENPVCGDPLPPYLKLSRVSGSHVPALQQERRLRQHTRLQVSQASSNWAHLGPSTLEKMLSIP